MAAIDHHTPPSPPSKARDLDVPAGDEAVVMRCTLPPHCAAVPFASYDDYEVHYAQQHVNRCAQCGRNFPTAHYLALHIEGNHDALVVARRARGEKTFRCFVEGCEKVCATAQKRRLHLVDKHAFPR
ncbi:hypothetical protein KEM52_003229, partial [Ascosphaera acerosa]